MASSAPSPRVLLPRSRSFSRARPMRLWWLALAIAVITNLGMVVGLSQISRLHAAAPPPPLTVRTLRQVPPETPPPPPEQPHETPEEKPEEIVPLALPNLDLPSVSTTSTLSLPTSGNLDPDLSLPISVPAFSAVGPAGDAPTAQIGAPIGPPAFDTPAQVDTAFDLDRYYPRTARLRGVTGSSHLRIGTDANGRVVSVQVLDSSPAGVFETAAALLGHALHFRPAQAQGKPVASVQDITIEWTLK